MKATKLSAILAVTLLTTLIGLGTLVATALTGTPAATPRCGSPSPATIPRVVSGHHDDTVTLNGDTRIAGLKVRPGHRFFVAKVVVTSNTGGPHTVVCTLTAGNAVDVSDAVLPPDQATTATMTTVQTFATTDTATVSCNGVSGTSASHLPITGIRAGTLFDQAIS
jgi:hypothetical protein